ncbi:hypothetical protein QBC40DRAFT_264753 [Triangularia verruculosa]|uniref:Uncharacterized protein n=1 Tax=Triangularia verruculosa TaxID=2587418 RepID=A0AAN6XHJ2_9PEZI|nr:hypothetical protein QBC40DRAFT_264753 [Triangularia verruculosa]
MHAFAIITTLCLALATAAPVEDAQTSPNLEARQNSFQYRFYRDSNCNHNAAPDSTFPRNGTPPGQGVKGQCYSAPTGTNWQRVEVDQYTETLITFCNVNCQGSGSAYQGGNTACHVPFPGCAIGSFKIV